MQQEQQVSAEKPKHVVCQHFSCSSVKRVVRLHVEEGSFLTPPKRVARPTWGPPPPCKQALTVKLGKSLTPGTFWRAPYWKCYRNTLTFRKNF